MEMFYICAFFICLLSSVHGEFSSSDERGFLVEFKNSVSDPHGILRSWNNADGSNHCSWFGVSCDASSRVSALKIRATNGKLRGKLSDVVGELEHLRVLSLPFNDLRGEIPVQIWRLENLEVLDLEGNLISGDFSTFDFDRLRKLRILNLGSNRIFGKFPGTLSRCADLQIINLVRNEINGNIPRFIGGLRSLRSIDLAENCLTGEVRGLFGKCANLRYMNLSSNRLIGASVVCSSDQQMPSSKFASAPIEAAKLRDALRSNKNRLFSTHLQEKVMGEKDTDERASPDSNDSMSLIIVACATSAFGAAVIILICSIARYCVCCCKDERQDSVPSNTRAAPVPPQMTTTANAVSTFRDVGVAITYESIVRATDNFDRRYCIGSGGFGSTYRARLSPTITVAVKRLASERRQGVAQFQAEVRTLRRVRHPNIITLVGSHSSVSDTFLIYNYMPGGNLDRYIRERAARAFDWAALHRIALHVGSALSFLHEGRDPCVLHRDVKPSNVLLDRDRNAFLSDFGLAMFLDASRTHATTRAAGTHGYMAPEYTAAGRASKKSDVYGYGVMLLELMSYKRALDPSFRSFGDGFDIVSWAHMLVDQGQAEDFFLDSLWDRGPRDKLAMMLHVAVMCTLESYEARPTMSQVVRRLRQIEPRTEQS